MYAIVRSGGKQYKVECGTRFRVEKLLGNLGETITLHDVLLVGGESPSIGTPLVEGMGVECKIIEQHRTPKVVIFKYKRRKRFRRRQGHRQPFTTLEVLKIGAKIQPVMENVAPTLESNPTKKTVTATPKKTPSIKKIIKKSTNTKRKSTGTAKGKK